jgi:uncharacterized membrane protein
MVPMILYRVFRKIIGPEAAFLSVFVFLSYPSTYVELTQLEREMIAELIMVLLLWLQLSATLKSTRANSFLVVLLTLGLVISHYSTALIYMFLVIFSYVASRMSRLRLGQIQPFASIDLLAISLVLGLSWFLFAAGGAVLQTLSSDLAYVVAGLTGFFNPTTRPYVIVDALGLAGPPQLGVFHLISRLTQYLVAFCIILGLLIYMHKSKKTRVENVLTPLMVASMGMLLAAVVFPYLARTLNLSRIYQITSAQARSLKACNAFAHLSHGIGSESKLVDLFLRPYCFRICCSHPVWFGQ